MRTLILSCMILYILIIGHPETCVYTENGAGTEHTAPTCTGRLYMHKVMHFVFRSIMSVQKWHTNRSSSHHLQKKASVSINTIIPLPITLSQNTTPNYGSREWPFTFTFVFTFTFTKYIIYTMIQPTAHAHDCSSRSRSLSHARSRSRSRPRSRSIVSTVRAVDVLRVHYVEDWVSSVL